MIREEIKRKIRDIVGSENASIPTSSVLPIPMTHPSYLCCQPTSRPRRTTVDHREVSKVMAIAYEHEIPVTPRALRADERWEYTLKSGISLSLDRMTKILELDEKNMMVTAEAGFALSISITTAPPRVSSIRLTRRAGSSPPSAGTWLRTPVACGLSSMG